MRRTACSRGHDLLSLIRRSAGVCHNLIKDCLVCLGAVGLRVCTFDTNVVGALIRQLKLNTTKATMRAIQVNGGIQSANCNDCIATPRMSPEQQDYAVASGFESERRVC